MWGTHALIKDFYNKFGIQINPCQTGLIWKDSLLLPVFIWNDEVEVELFICFISIAIKPVDMEQDELLQEMAIV